MLANHLPNEIVIAAVPRCKPQASRHLIAAGVIVDRLGYSAAFLTLGAAAAVALIVFALGMPETAERQTATLPN
jgi:hypothetical protein